MSTAWQVVKTYPDLSNHSACSHLLRYWGGILGISVHCWNETSEYGVVNRIVCEGWGTNHFWTLFMSNMWSTNNFCLKEKHGILLQVLESLLKHVLRGGHNFKSGGGYLRFLLCDNTHAHSAMIMKCMLASYGILVISHPLYLPLLIPSDFFCSWKWKPSLKEQDFRTSRTSIM